jgi:hypothetical protein
VWRVSGAGVPSRVVLPAALLPSPHTPTPLTQHRQQHKVSMRNMGEAYPIIATPYTVYKMALHCGCLEQIAIYYHQKYKP